MFSILKTSLVFFSVTMSSLLAFAIQPEEVCDGVVTCSEPMKQIAESFKGTGPVVLDGPQAFSGVCYYISGATSKETSHAGLAVFTPSITNQTEYRGLFSFYGKPSDYADLTYEQAFKQVNSTRPANVLIDGPRYSGYLSENGEAAFSYWFGMSPDKKEISLLSIWIYEGSISQVAFCKMQGHSK